MSVTKRTIALLSVLALCFGASAQDEAAAAPEGAPEAAAAELSETPAPEAAPAAEATPAAEAAPVEKAAEETAGDKAIEKAVEMETARKDFGMVKESKTEDVTIGVAAIDTFFNLKPLWRKSLLSNPATGVEAADRFAVYLSGYLASLEGLKLAEIDEERLKAVMAEIEAGQLGAREEGKENKWLGVDAFVGGAYGYSKLKKMGFVPLKHTKLKVTVAETGETFEHIALPPYSTSGSSDVLMAYHAAQDLRDLVTATPEQRELVAQITLTSQKRQFVKAAGWILQLLAGVEYIVAGYVASQWEDEATSHEDNYRGFKATKVTCYTMGILGVVAAPINPIMAAIHKAKEKKLKREYNEKYGEKYALK